MLAGLIYFVGAFIEFLVGMRFIFRLLGANPGNPFVNWIYDWSTPLVSPFAGILGQNATIQGVGTVTVSVFDWAALIAFIVYGVIFTLLSGLFRRSRPAAV